jgi:hypothetical protein
MVAEMSATATTSAATAARAVAGVLRLEVQTLLERLVELEVKGLMAAMVGIGVHHLILWVVAAAELVLRAATLRAATAATAALAELTE